MAINPEIQYPGKVEPSSSDYPYGAARNVAVPGDGTGTPWEAALVNDIFGWQQAMLSAAAIVPSGSPEKATASQYLDALNALHGRTIADTGVFAAANFKAGVRIVTRGYTAANDGGAALYTVLTAAEFGGTPDGIGDFELANGNVAKLTPVNDVVLAEQFGVFASVSANQTNLVAFFEHESRLKLLSKDYGTTAALSVTISNKHVYGGGKVINNGTGADVFTITGDENLIEDIGVESTANQQAQTRMFYVVGSRNVVTRVRAGWQVFSNPTVDGTQYGSVGINVSGDNNTVDMCRTFNTNTGISDGGIGNNITRNIIDQSCTGISVGNRSRQASITDNFIDCKQGGVGLQGCDGIWGNRNHRFTVIKGNRILNAGEHGTYLQGDSFRVIGNYVSGCHGDGIKVGAKTTGNYWYPGETVRELAPNGDYTGFDIIIDGNTCEGNRTTGGTGAEIYLQPNTMDAIISNNTVRFGGAYGIRTVFFSGGTADEVMKGISVLGNKVHDCVETPISIVASSDLVIADNETDGPISTSSRDSGEPTIRSKISGNICEYIVVGRQDNCIVEDNLAKYVFVNNNFAKLYGNEFTEQEQGDFNGRVLDMRNNTFAYTGDVTALIQSCNRVEGNTFLFPDALGTYPLDVNFNSITPVNGVFSDNVISAPQSDRPLRIGGDNGSICGNSLTSNGTDTFAMGCYSNDCVISGNVITAGSIRLESGSANNVVSSNGAKVSDAGTGNIIGTNRV